MHREQSAPRGNPSQLAREKPGMLQRIESLLARPGAPLWLGLCAVMLCLPSLRYGLQADDHMFPAKLEAGTPAWSLFQLDPADLPGARERGDVAWWGSPRLAARFFRPLASLSHALDFSLWPDAPWLMRLFNVLLYGGLVTLAALLYRRLAPSIAAAALAGLLFAIDEGHAFSVGWISGRNTLMAAFFALLALLLHMRACETGRLSLRLSSAGAVALALLSAEAGVWALALLVSHAWVLEQGSLGTRLRGIALPLLVGTAYVAVYVALGCGFRGSSFYRDPSAPLSALGQGLLDLPIWFADLLGPGGLPFALLYPSSWVRLGALAMAPGLLWLLLPALRSSRECRFFALASLLCLAPLLCTQPTSRVLLGPSFGALGWAACSIAAGTGAADRRTRWGARLLLACHVVWAAAVFLPGLSAAETFAYGTQSISAAMAPGRDVVLVQSPMELLSNQVLTATSVRARAHAAPHSLHQLYSGASQLWVERVDARTLDIEVEHGWGHVIMERIFCAPEDMPAAGSERSLGAFTARVLQSNADGMPQRVRFVFPTALESPERQWLSWEQNRVLPWTPPRQGQRVRLVPLSFFRALRP
jgi:hypothetical protein